MSDYPARFHTARLRLLAAVAGVIAAAALALGLGLAPARAVAEETPPAEAAISYPPYPYEVWGRQLPIKTPIQRATPVEALAAPDGDVIFAFKDGETAGTLAFFSGRLEMGQEAYQKAVETLPKLPMKEEIKLGGTRKYVSWHSRQFDQGTCCGHYDQEEGNYHGFGPEIILYVDNTPSRYYYFGSNTILMKQVIIYLEEPRKPPYQNEWEKQNPNMQFDEYVFSLQFDFIPLPNYKNPLPFVEFPKYLKNTEFLGFSREAGLVIKFEPDLTSFFIDGTGGAQVRKPPLGDKRLFLLDYRTVSNIYMRAARTCEQQSGPPDRDCWGPKAEHDAVRAYLDWMRAWWKPGMPEAGK